MHVKDNNSFAKNRYNNTAVSSSYEGDKTKSKTEFDFKNAESNQFILDAETFIDAGLYSEFKEQIESLNNTDVNDLRKQFDSKGNYKSYNDEEFKDIVRKDLKDYVNSKYKTVTYENKKYENNINFFFSLFSSIK